MNTATDAKRKSASADKEFRLAICGGGSGGHLTPGIAVAEELQRRVSQSSVTFLASSRDIDGRVLRESIESHAKWTHESLPNFGRGRLKSLIEITRSTLAARRILKHTEPHVVLGTGGFASIPGSLAATMLRIPVVLLECNVLPGRANRLLNRFAKLTLCGFSMQKEYVQWWNSAVETTGVPVRHCFSGVDSRRNPGAPKVLVIGGSQGASTLDELVVAALGELVESSHSFSILHQTGERNAETVRQNWGTTPNVEVVPFIDDLAKELQRADIVISRAGAVAMAEIAACGCPAILIPLPNSADDHQRANAEYFRASGAAIVVDQADTDAAGQLRSAVANLLNGTTEEWEQASKAMRSLAKPDAVGQIVSQILQCSSG